ncbi:MAG: hypothetical protein V7K35_08585, partial [Nostoc sp.]|uniref:hypothetical protein n=1 Tax=Nostoc sp. TaxID=1180 RepID=UPI002FF9DD6F
LLNPKGGSLRCSKWRGIKGGKDVLHLDAKCCIKIVDMIAAETPTRRHWELSGVCTKVITFNNKNWYYLSI